MKQGSNRPPSKLKLYLLLGLVVLFWSANFIAAKFALREFPPMLLTCLRAEFAALIIVPVYFWKSWGKPSQWTRRDIPMLVVLGILGVALNQVFFVFGTSLTSVGHSALMIGMMPLMVLVMSAVLGHEPITWKKTLGLLVALGGIAVLNFSPGKSAGASLNGDLLVLAGAATFAAFTVGGKGVSKRHDSITVNTFAYLSAGLVLAPFTYYLGRDFPLASLSWVAWAAIFYMAAIASVVCYLLYYYVLTFIPASRVSAASYIQPLVATLMAVPALGEPITGGLALGGALILAGVYLTERG